jgi:hypothetical protein
MTEEVETKAEETVDTATEETKSTEKQTLGEQHESTDETNADETKSEEKTVDSESTETPETVDEQTTAAEEGEEEISSFLEGAEKKSGEQKRIDKLTAEKYALKAELEAVKNAKSSKDESSSDDSKEYSEAQLSAAMKKAMDEGDHELMMEIIKYSNEKTKKDLIKQYKEQENKRAESAKQAQREWKQVVDSYSYLSDKNEPELYKDSHKELNINDRGSTLFKLADALYSSKEDEERFQLYHRPGGQALAVGDAFKLILKKRLAMNNDTKVNGKRIKQSLVKERRKKSLTATDDVIKDDTVVKSKKPLTDKERLDEYITSRKTTRSKADRALGLT